MSVKSNKTTKYLILLLFVISVYGCTKKVKPPVIDVAKPPVEEPKKTVEVSTTPAVIEVSTENVIPAEVPHEEEPPLRGEEFHAVPEMQAITFDYDKTEISSDDQKKLQANAEYLKKNPQLEILVEGNCCECGTSEYNQALGQKRAQVVKEYYVQLGIDAVRIATISYGSEKPVNKNAGPPDSILCKDNRKSETKARARK